FFYHIVRKSLNHQLLGLLLSYSTTAQIKHGVFIELTNGRAMTTFHIICKYLQLRLGMYRSVVAKKNIVTLLECICFLCILVYKDFAVKHRTAIIHHYTFIKLIALTSWHFMVHLCMIIYQLRSCANVQTIKMAL